MAAVLGLEPRAVEAICIDGAVVANLNSATQTVVAGTRPAVDAVEAIARDNGSSEVLRLDVSGAFHSPLMAPAEAAIAPLVADLPLHHGSVPMVSSVTGGLVTDVSAYRRNLARQITAPVRWSDVMNTLATLGITEFVEVGPGRALRGLLRRTNRRWSLASCQTRADCEDLAAAARAVLEPVT